MRIGIVTPAPPGSNYGNRITAVRWARILRRLGHRVSISQAYDGEPYDLLVALHARRSYQSINRFRRQNIHAPIIVALTGTDLYQDIRSNPLARESLEIATRIVALQPKAFEELREDLRAKTRVIYQSVEDQSLAHPTKARSKKQAFSGSSNGESFDVCVIGHLRPVKDPFRAARASRLLPQSSRIRVLQVGGAMTTVMAARANAEARANPRYHWLGEQSRARVRRILAKSHLCVLSSHIEGGANVVSEAIVASAPIVASRIDGNVGILGADYPGFFTAGDTHQLALLMKSAESDPTFLFDLRARVKALAPVFDPKREDGAWKDLISELE